MGARCAAPDRDVAPGRLLAAALPAEQRRAVPGPRHPHLPAAWSAPAAAANQPSRRRDKGVPRRADEPALATVVARLIAAGPIPPGPRPGLAHMRRRVRALLPLLPSIPPPLPCSPAR